MTGIAVYLVTGLVLFTPIGFLAGYIQHKNDEKREKEMNEPERFDKEDKKDN